MTKNRKFELIYYCRQYPKNREMVDGCIEEATVGHPGLKTPLLKNVTQGIEFRYLDAPCGRRQFYERRRVFFDSLDRKRN